MSFQIIHLVVTLVFASIWAFVGQIVISGART
jgi:hypothetical protein